MKKIVWRIEAYHSFMRGDEECWNLDDVMSYRTLGLTKDRVLRSAMTKARKHFKHLALTDNKLKVKVIQADRNLKRMWESQSLL